MISGCWAAFIFTEAECVTNVLISWTGHYSDFVEEFKFVRRNDSSILCSNVLYRIISITLPNKLFQNIKLIFHFTDFGDTSDFRGLYNFPSKPYKLITSPSLLGKLIQNQQLSRFKVISHKVIIRSRKNLCALPTLCAVLPRLRGTLTRHAPVATHGW